MIDPTVLFVTGADRSGDATASALESIGLHAITADDQLDAVKRLEDGGIDCLVLAPPLGDPSLAWLVRYTRRTRDSIPILLVGGRSDSIAAALAAGATDHVEHDDVTRIADRVNELVADRRARRALERHRALKNRVFEIAVALSEATDPTEVARVVYARFAADDRFHTVWVGSYDSDADTVRIRFPSRGESGAESVAIGSPVTDAEFVERAIASGSVERSTAGAVTDGKDGESVAGDRGGAVAVPLVHGDSTHGVVVLGIEPSDTIDGSARSLLADLGTLVGRELHRLQGRTQADGDDVVRRFAEGLAHELRNTLGIASTHLELGRDGDEEALDRAQSAIDELDRTVDGMLSLSTGVEETMERDLREDVADAWGALEAPDAELVVDESEPIDADHDQVVLLLANLFRNAVEHGTASAPPVPDEAVEQERTNGRSASGGDAADESPVTIRVGTHESGFYVEDDGPGIPSADRDHVFEWGYSAAGGTGIGLGVVDAIADAHGWSVEATEGRAGGARFEVTGVGLPSD